MPQFCFDLPDMCLEASPLAGKEREDVLSPFLGMTNRQGLAGSFSDNVTDARQASEASESLALEHPRDRNGKLVQDRWSTAELEAALDSYREACSIATKAVRMHLCALAKTVEVMMWLGPCCFPIRSHVQRARHLLKLAA